MKTPISTFAIGPCIMKHSHLMKPAKNEKFGYSEYSVVALVDDSDAQTIQAMCEELIERALPCHTQSQKTGLRIPGDYDNQSGRIRLRLSMRPQFGKPEVSDRQGNLITKELPDLSIAFIGGMARIYRDYGGGVLLVVTHVIVEQLGGRKSKEAVMKALNDEKAPPVKPGQTFMEYLNDCLKAVR